MISKSYCETTTTTTSTESNHRSRREGLEQFLSPFAKRKARRTNGLSEQMLNQTQKDEINIPDLLAKTEINDFEMLIEEISHKKDLTTGELSPRVLYQGENSSSQELPLSLNSDSNIPVEMDFDESLCFSPRMQISLDNTNMHPTQLFLSTCSPSDFPSALQEILPPGNGSLRRSSLQLQVFEPSLVPETSSIYDLLNRPTVSRKRESRKTSFFSFLSQTDEETITDAIRLPRKLQPLISKSVRADLYIPLPKVKIEHQSTPRLVAKLKPTSEEYVGLEELLGYQMISTYPRMSNSLRAGDPLCDNFCLDLYEKQAVISLCDGCNWGYGPREAAIKASSSFNLFVSQRLSRIKNLKKAASILLKGLAAAQYAITDRPQGVPRKKLESGTTTLLGALLLPQAPQRKPFRLELTSKNMANDIVKKWALLVANVGDCKAFLWSHATGEVTDITRDNRFKSDSASDCGGRLGAYIDGKPDLRNLKLYYQECSEGDLVFFMTDGVHDNYDPQTSGVPPQMLGFEDWNDEGVGPAKSDYMERLLTQMINREKPFVTPRGLIRTLLKYCVELTLPSRKFMETYPAECLPDDYVLYPGKMDHCSVICLRVSTNYNFSPCTSPFRTW